MINECIPKYEPGQDLTGHCTANVTGRRFLRISGDKQGVEAVSDDTSGGNIQVAQADPGQNAGRIVGVAGYDSVAGRKVKVVRGAGKVIPVEAGAAIAAFQEVETDALGRAVPSGTAAGARAVGYAFRSVSAAGQFVLVHLYA